jgi:hypothetical protein
MNRPYCAPAHTEVTALHADSVRRRTDSVSVNLNNGNSFVALSLCSATLENPSRRLSHDLQSFQT